MRIDHIQKNRPRMSMTPTRIVIHWTANIRPGATAANTKSYFNRTSRKVSAHYVVDDFEVVECVPPTEIAWHVNEDVNLDSIGIEMCVNGNFVSMYRRTIRLVRELMERFDIPISEVYRHFDFTGKDCPRFLMPTIIHHKEYDWNWQLFKHHLEVGMDPEFQVVTEVETQSLSSCNTIDLLSALLAKLIKR